MRAVFGLAQPQVSDWPEQYRLECHTCLASLGDLQQKPRSIESKRRLRRKLRDDVVVIGIEPLGHLACGDAGAEVTCSATTRDAEVGVECPSIRGRALGDVPEQKAGVEHVVVKGKITDRHQIEAGLASPVLLTQLGGELFQIGVSQKAFPVLLFGKLEFALSADAGKSEIVRAGHALEGSLPVLTMNPTAL